MSVFFIGLIFMSTILIKVVIGLGNPGPKFENTRHNIGFKVIDLVAQAYDASWSSKQKMEMAEIFVDGRTVYLVKPQTFMNASGEVIPFFVKKGIKAEEILVVHDEMEKKFGTLTVSQGTSHKGHNGLKSIITSIGNNFHKFRCGIGRPEDGYDVGDYVLSNFREDKKQLDDFIHAAASQIIDVLQNKLLK